MTIHSSFLKYFDETRRSGSIRGAARQLFVASSAVNRQILNVEDRLGAKLFVRSASGLTLTAAGELLATHVSQTLADEERMLAEIAALAEDASPSITIAGQESVIARFLPPALLELHAQVPAASSSFKAASGTQLIELLLAGRADVALAFDPEPNPAVRFVETRDLPVNAVMTPKHPLARRKHLSISECAQYPIVLPDQSWPLRKLIDRALTEAGIEPTIITSSNSVEFLRAMVGSELGIGFQTRVGIEAAADSGEVVLVPMAGPGPLMQAFTLCVRSDQAEAPLTAKVLALLRRRLGEYARADEPRR